MEYTTLPALQQEVKRRIEQATLVHEVGPDGSITSEIAIIAEAPGERELATGRPLMGGSGNVLWDALRKVGITRNQCYITNVSKRLVALSQQTNDRLALTNAELNHYEHIVRWEIDQLPNVKYVLLLGNYALRAFMNANGITNWRGSVIEKDGRHYVATFNPAMILREPKNSTIFAFDINKFSRVMEGRWKPTECKAMINPSYTEACKWVDKMHDEKLPVSWDIETIANQTACHGFANSVNEGMCINLRNKDTNRYSLQEEAMLLRRIQRLLQSKQVQLVTQNGMFDSSWCWWKDRLRAGAIWYDTMLAHHTLYPMLPHGLGFLTTQYTDNPYYKDESKEWREGGDIDTYWEYNVKDLINTLLVQRGTLTELRNQGLEKFFFNHIMALQPHLIRMTVNGILCDVRLKDQIAKDLNEDVNNLREQFYKVVQRALGDDTARPNPASAQQMKKLLYIDLGVRTRTRGNTDALARTKMLESAGLPEDHREILTLLNKYKTESKFLSTYAEMTIDSDNRVRCEYKQTGVANAPGRLSSAAVSWGTGANLQNQPARAYPMYIADSGYEFNYFDLSGAEARIVAHVAKIRQWIDDFHLKDTDNTGAFDPHRATASQVFGIPYDEIPIDDRDEKGNVTLRFIGKKCKHGLNYRMQPARLAETTGISMVLAEKAHRAYHHAYPELRKWWDNTIKEVHKTKQLWTPMGRRLIILGRLDDDRALDSIIAFVPQSTIGDKVSQCIYQCERDPEWPKDARMVLNIHDALVCLNKIGTGHIVKRIMKKYAESPIIINGTPVVIPAEFATSEAGEDGVHRWSTLVKDH